MIKQIARQTRKGLTDTPLDARTAALRVGPIFGGTSNEPPPAGGAPPQPDPNAQGGQPDPNAQAGQPDPNAPPDQISNDPKVIAQLLKQVSDLQKTLSSTTAERDKFVEDQQKAERAQQTREQQLETDLANSQAAVEKMDRVIRTMAVQNAFLSAADIQWNSVRQAMAELDDSAYDIDVNLDGGTATVNGIESEVKRIAEKCPWLVKAAAADEGNNGNPPKPRKPASGTPPAPPNNNEAKVAKRADLMKRFPAIIAK